MDHPNTQCYYWQTFHNLDYENLFEERHLAIAKVIEVIAGSTKGIEDAVSQGIAKASETVTGIEGAWVKDTKVVVKNGQITEWRVILSITFIVE